MDNQIEMPQSYGSTGTTQTSLADRDGPSVQYLAGFFDGEGSIYANKPNRNIPVFFISVQTTKRTEPKYYRDRWGGSVHVHERQQENHSTSYSWRVSGEAARIAVEQMLPYLRGKEEEAKLFLEAIAFKLQARQGRSQYPEEAHEPLIEYANDIRSMSADRGGKTLEL